MPEPLSPKIGFGMKVAVLLLRSATLRTMYLNFITASAELSSSSKRQLISAWPAVPPSCCTGSAAGPPVAPGPAGGAHLVVPPLDRQAGLLQFDRDLVTDVGEVVHRRHREVA